MDKRGPPLRVGRGGGGRDSRTSLVLGLLAAQLAVAGIIYYAFRSRTTTAPPVGVHLSGGGLSSKDSLLHEGEQLQSQLAEWKRRALAAGLSVDHQALSLEGGRPQQVQAVQRTTQAQAQSAVLVGSTTGTVAAATDAASAVCMPNGHPVTTVAPIEPKYLMRPAEEVAKEHPDLAKLLPLHANQDREIMLAFANAVMICKNTTVCWWGGGNILESFLEILERSNITNHLIGITDDETDKYLADRQASGKTKFKINWWRPKVEISKAQAGTREANRVSSLKFSLLQAMMQMGYHVLISDLDLVYISNPFDHLHRDADIESSTDGFDPSAYGTMDGIHDSSMGWGGGGLFIRIFTVNVGCAYIRATHRAFTLVKRAADQLAAEPGWDQQVFNQHLLTVSKPDQASPYATLRVMDYLKFINSKTYFRSHRSQFIPGKDHPNAATPVMVHFNYHPDKHARMLCIMDRYFHGNLSACDHFPGGSEPGTR